MQATPTLRHQSICDTITSEFKQYFKGKECRAFSAPYDIIMNNEEGIKRVQPDVFVLCGCYDLDKNEFEGVPDLVVEVLSPSNSWFDLSEKFILYQSMKVKEYWIVKPKSKSIDVFSLGDDGYYKEPDVYSINDEYICSILFRDLKVNIMGLFE